MVNSVNNITRYNQQQTSQHIKQSYVAEGVDTEFANSIFNSYENMRQYSPKVLQALAKIDNIIILKDKNSEIPDEFSKTNEKFQNCALDAFGFISRRDKAIVVVEDNHERKNAELEGSVLLQGEDTVTHEVGHLVDNELSSTDTFKQAYLADLKNIYSMLQQDDAKVCGENVKEMMAYLKHYVEGVNFEDGIDESDITREGLRENFAECFSTIVDSNPAKINEIYSSLFPNTMKTTKEFIA